MGEFPIYLGDGTVDTGGERIRRRAEPPPWRRFGGGPAAKLDRDAPAISYQGEKTTVRMVNVALHLRRPLLVTGDPGTGKSTLAYAVAHELRLGAVLRWPITSRSTLVSGLYHYDAVGRIEEASLRQSGAGQGAGGPGVANRGTTGKGAAGNGAAGSDAADRAAGESDIGRFIRLGPLGTAFAPYELPRVLLIDEIDKGDIDLPNELLDIFEMGEYGIPELERIADRTASVLVRPADHGERVTVEDGRVRCREFPLVIMTSNGEREFPPAFLRRCVRLHLDPPSPERLRTIVEAHLGPEALAASEGVIDEFLGRRNRGQLATDQLLNAVYLLHLAGGAGQEDVDDLVEVVLRELNGPA